MYDFNENSEATATEESAQAAEIADFAEEIAVELEGNEGIEPEADKGPEIDGGIVTVPIASLRALGYCKEKDPYYRPNIGGIKIESGPDGKGAHCIATNGHVLLKVDLDENQVMGVLPEGGFILPAEFIPTKGNHGNILVQLTGAGELKVTEIGQGSFKVGKPIEDITFPDWRRVMPEIAEPVKIDGMTINPVEMEILLKVAKVLGSKAIYMVYGKDDTAPYTVTFKNHENVTMVYMPMRK